VGQDCVSVSTPSKAVDATPGSLGPEPSTHRTEVLCAKAFLPMMTTLSGTMMMRRDVQLKNELLPMRVIVFGMLRTLKSEQSRSSGYTKLEIVAGMLRVMRRLC